jgi:hypothetical protein
MGRQLNDPNFDPENDEWVGACPVWDSQSSPTFESSGRQGSGEFLNKQKAPTIDSADFRVVFDQLDKSGLSMTYQRCLEQLHLAGRVDLELDHVTLVAELSEIRSRTRDWTGVPSNVRRLATSLGERRKQRRSKQRRSDRRGGETA